MNPGLGLRAWRYQALKGWVARMSWLDLAWILTATVVIAAAAATIFLLGGYVLGLLYSEHEHKTHGGNRCGSK
jgi:hypothetical protein